MGTALLHHIPARTLHYPKISCPSPSAVGQPVPASPARQEGGVWRLRGAGGCPHSLPQPRLRCFWDSSGLCQTPIKLYKFS